MKPQGYPVDKLKPDGYHGEYRKTQGSHGISHIILENNLGEKIIKIKLGEILLLETIFW